MMEREKALALLKENLKNKNLLKHCLAVEAAMRALAKRFNEDIEKWGVCGLLHDIDYELVSGEMHLHSKKGADMLKDLGLEQEIYEAVLTHNEAHGLKPESLMAKALFCVDPLTGLIVAATLVLSPKKINELSAGSVVKRFKEKAFARGANRQIIAQCKEYLGLSLEEFITITLSAMQQISEELDL